MKIKTIKENLIKLIRPFREKRSYHCIVCREMRDKNKCSLTDNNICICKDCTDKLDRYSSVAVYKGGKDYVFLITGYPYKGLLKRAFSLFKFYGEWAYGELFGIMMAERIKPVIQDIDIDLVLSVPLSRERLIERGYNQSSIIAKRVSEEIKIPHCEDAILRVKNTKKQSLLGKFERIENMKNAFLAREDIIKGKNILLIDDIFTLGVTMNECAGEIMKKGANSVVGATLFKTELKIRADEEIPFVTHKEF